MELARALLVSSVINKLEYPLYFADPFSVVVSRKDKRKEVSSRGGDDVD